MHEQSAVADPCVCPVNALGISCRWRQAAPLLRGKLVGRCHVRQAAPLLRGKASTLLSAVHQRQAAPGPSRVGVTPCELVTPTSRGSFRGSCVCVCVCVCVRVWVVLLCGWRRPAHTEVEGSLLTTRLIVASTVSLAGSNISHKGQQSRSLPTFTLTPPSVEEMLPSVTWENYRRFAARRVDARVRFSSMGTLRGLVVADLVIKFPGLASGLDRAA